MRMESPKSRRHVWRCFMRKSHRKTSSSGKKGAVGSASSSTSFSKMTVAPASSILANPDYQGMLKEIASRKFHEIRYPEYRAACKLRFIQRRTNMQYVDLWNDAVEAIRDNGLDVFQGDKRSNDGHLPAARLQTSVHAVITSVFYQLSRRLPPSMKINVDESVNLLYSFLVSIFDPQELGLLNVFSVTLALVILSSGKIEDKLTYIYSLMSDPVNGNLIPERFSWFIRDLFSLARGVHESSDSFFEYDDGLPSRILCFDHPICLKEFIGVTSEDSLSCFAFFKAFSRMPEVERVIHPVPCKGCKRNGFTGYRYECQKCIDFQLCQECFWRGKTSGSHDPDTHNCREYCFWQTNVTSASIHRSFRGQKPNRNYIRDATNRSLNIDLQPMVPASPGKENDSRQTLDNNAAATPSTPFKRGSHAYGSMPNMPPNSTSSPRVSHSVKQLPSNPLSNNGHQEQEAEEGNDEHKLVQEYVRRLSQDKSPETPVLGRKTSLLLSSPSHDEVVREKQAIICQLEQRNRQVMQEIERLRRGDVTLDDLTSRSGLSPSSAASTTDTNNHSMMEPLYATELTGLRMRRDELEQHLSTLHDSRKELLCQLESLMNLLKSNGTLLTSRPSSAASSLSRTGVRVSSLRIRDNSSGTRSGEDSVKKAMTSLAKELNSEDEEAIDELGLNLSKKLAMKMKYSTSASSNRSQEFKGSTNGVTKDDFDEDELALNLLRDQMTALRKSCKNEGTQNGMNGHPKLTSTSSQVSRDSALFDGDDTDIYPESEDDEFYTKSWVNKNDRIIPVKSH